MWITLLTMASAAASMASLAKVFGLMKISKADQDGLKDQCNIATVQQLVASRPRLAYSHHSTTCRLLVAAIDFIQPKRLAAPDVDDAQVHKYFETKDRPLKESWEFFLATMIHRAMSQSGQSNRTEHSAEASAQKSAQNTKAEKKFRAGDTYWVEVEHESDEEALSDDETDGLDFGASSLWLLDKVNLEVCLKRAADIVRIPLSLFKMLYPFQRDGVAWIAGLFLDDSGGILGE